MRGGPGFPGFPAKSPGLLCFPQSRPRVIADFTPGPAQAGLFPARVQPFPDQLKVPIRDRHSPWLRRNAIPQGRDVVELLIECELVETRRRVGNRWRHL